MKDNIIEKLLIKKARKSICRFKVSAVAFDKKGRMLGISYNNPRILAKGRGDHAEMKLMARYGDLIHSIVIMRVGKNGALLPIRPCCNCSKRAESLGIKIHSVN